MGEGYYPETLSKVAALDAPLPDQSEIERREMSMEVAGVTYRLTVEVEPEGGRPRIRLWCSEPPGQLHERIYEHVDRGPMVVRETREGRFAAMKARLHDLMLLRRRHGLIAAAFMALEPQRQWRKKWRAR